LGSWTKWSSLTTDDTGFRLTVSTSRRGARGAQSDSQGGDLITKAGRRSKNSPDAYQKGLPLFSSRVKWRKDRLV